MIHIRTTVHTAAQGLDGATVCGYSTSNDQLISTEELEVTMQDDICRVCTLLLVVVDMSEMEYTLLESRLEERNHVVCRRLVNA